MKRDTSNQQYHQHWRKKRNKRRTHTEDTTTKLSENYRNNSKKQQLRFLRTAKLVTIAQMPGKNGRMQQLPQNGTLCKSLPQKNQ